MFIRDDGIRFETEEEAREDMEEWVFDDFDFEDDFFRYISKDKLLRWAMKNPAFWDEFAEEVSKAKEDIFEDFCSEVEEEEEE